MGDMAVLLGLALALSLASGAATGDAVPAPAPIVKGFADHLRDAIALNRERRGYYASRSASASLDLSNRLIAQERMALLAAGAFDDRARPFERQGIPVVSGAFMPMSHAPDPATPCEGAKAADPATVARARELLATLSSEIHAALKADDFRSAAGACARAAARIEDLERSSASHFAMCLHIIHSLGYGAVWAIECAGRSGGATMRLSRDLIAIQTLALAGAVDTDIQAQEVQRAGVGILINDLPQIPFVERWQALDAEQHP